MASGAITKLQAAIDGTGIINRVRVIGAQQAISTTTPTTESVGYYEDDRTGDGTTKIYKVSHTPLYRMRWIYLDGVVHDFTTDWTTDEGDDIYINYTANTVHFATAPAAGVAIRIIYWYTAVGGSTTTTEYLAAVSVVRDVTDLGYAEPNIWFDLEITDATVTTVEQAQAVADAILYEYGQPIVVGSFVINKLGLEPSQQISITDPVLGLSGTYIIRKVTTELDKAGTGVIATVQFGGRPTRFSALFGKAGSTTLGYATGGNVTYTTTAPQVTEGPDISLIGTQVGRGGDTILLFDAGGEPLAEYLATAAGLAAALAAATAGDVVQLPACTLAGDYSVPAAVTLMGLGTHASVLTGQITGGAGAILENLAVTRTADDATKLVAVVGPATGALTVRECDLSATQAGAGDGYAISVSSGDVYVYNSRAYGSTALSDEALPE